jgi:GT2 family glycosyltransferase
MNLRQQEGKAGIIVGSTRDPKTDYCTYGGVVRRNKWRPMAYRRLEPSGKPQRCITMNGNCVLIPWEVAESIGNLSPGFTHSLGDFDYGLRASAKGVSIWIAPTYIGECSRSPLKPWVDPEISLRRRLEILRSPKGLPPREFLLYIKRHAGIYWPIHVLALYIRVLFPRLCRPYSKKRRYFI